MPSAQLVNSGIERILNQLIKLDPDSPRRLKVLAGKQLKLRINEFPWPLIFAFSDHVDVLTAESLTQHETPADCEIALSVNNLKQLQDSSQISRLIQQNKLQLEGDIHIAQNFSALIKDLHIDWEEQLSQYVGDVIAHQSFNSARNLFDHAKAKLDQFTSVLSDAALEEKAVAAHPVAVDDFCQSVNKLRSDTERLAARITRLEQQIK